MHSVLTPAGGFQSVRSVRPEDEEATEPVSDWTGPSDCGHALGSAGVLVSVDAPEERPLGETAVTTVLYAVLGFRPLFGCFGGWDCAFFFVSGGGGRQRLCPSRSSLSTQLESPSPTYLNTTSYDLDWTGPLPKVRGWGPPSS
jgi:hypothetical protein